jgi:hypothetical protein
MSPFPRPSGPRLPHLRASNAFYTTSTSSPGLRTSKSSMLTSPAVPPATAATQIHPWMTKNLQHRGTTSGTIPSRRRWVLGRAARLCCMDGRHRCKRLTRTRGWFIHSSHTGIRLYNPRLCTLLRSLHRRGHIRDPSGTSANHGRFAVLSVCG